MGVLTNTDPKDKTSLVAKDEDVVTGVPVDNAQPSEETVTTPPAADPEQQRANVYDLVAAAGSAAQDVISQPYITQTPERESTWEDLYRKLRPDSTPTPEDIVADAKRQKRNATFAAIGDFATALSNMGSTIAGAPNQKLADPTPGYNAHMKEIERLRKLREDNEARWEKGLVREQARDDKAYAQKLTDAQKKLSIEQRDRQAASKLYMSIVDALLKADKAEREGDILAAKKLKMEADAALAEAKAKGYDRLLNATVAQKYGSAAASYARSANGGSGGGSGGDKISLTIDGKTYTYKSVTDYNRAVMGYANQYNVPTAERGKHRKIEDIAADVEAAAKPKPKTEEKPKTPAGGNNGGNGKKKHLNGW